MTLSHETPFVPDDALTQSSANFRALVEGSPDPIFVIRDGIIRYANAAMAKLLGHGSPEEIVGRESLRDIVHPGDREKVLNFRRALANGESPGPLEVRWCRTDGDVVTISGVAVHIIFNGEPAMLTIARDVTDSRRAERERDEAVTEKLKLEEQLRQSQKMEAVGCLAGGVAHDFNNILSVILADADYIREELGRDHAVASHIDEIENAARRAAALTHQLLAFSRKQVLQPRALSMNVVVSVMEKMLRRIIGENVTLDVELEPALGTVMADRGQLEQVIMNLVVNARDALADVGRIVIRTENVKVSERDPNRPADLASGSYVALTVSDSGCGMDEATMARIFEPFFTTKEIGRGTGLGLATVFGIVKQSDGVVHVTSKPGEGSTFRVFFRRADEPEATAPTSRCIARARDGTERVLVVEDDPHVRRATATALRRRGYAVREASSGEEALRELDESRLELDILVTDLVMPGMNGVALATRFRAHHPKLNVLYTSGYAEGILEPKDLDARTAFLSKPFVPEDLAIAVRGVLDASLEPI